MILRTIAWLCMVFAMLLAASWDVAGETPIEQPPGGTAPMARSHRSAEMVPSGDLGRGNFFSNLSPSDPAAVRIGVLAKRGEDQCLEQWGPTADYLSSRIPAVAFAIIPLDFDEICQAVERRQVDFLLANSSFYIEMEAYYGARRIATLNNLQSDGTAHDFFAGVIFTRSDRRDLNRLEDIQGKICMAVDERSLGGWHMQWREMLEHGLDPHRDFKALRYGGTHDAVVLAVQNGNVDVGCVRSDTLERMALEGTIRLNDFKLIISHEPCDEGVRYWHSTRHYPEWPFVKAPHTDGALALKVAVALMRMPADSPAAIAARCAGWTIPQNYQPVRECLQALRLPPYQHYGRVSPGELWRQYRLWILGIAVMTGIIIASLVTVVRLRYRLARSLVAREARERAMVFLQSVVDGFPEPLMVINRDHTIALANRLVLERTLGEDTVDGGRKCFAMGFSYHLPCDGDLSACPFDRVFETGQSVSIEQAFQDEHGHRIVMEYVAAPIFDESGAVLNVIESCRDISERKLAESRLRNSEEKYRRIFENSIVGFFQSTPGGRFVNVNMAFARMLRYDSPDDLIAGIQEIATDYYVDPEDRRRFQRLLREDGKVDGMQLCVKCKDGAKIWVTNSTWAYFDDEGSPIHYEGVVSDITARREAENARESLERQIRQTQKMEAIGTLAGGIAHDFNNILFPLIGYAEMLQMDIADDSPLQKYVDQILKAALRSRDLVTQILSFSRQGDQPAQPLHIQPIIKEVLKLLRSSIPTTIDIETTIDPKCGMIIADPTQVHQVIMNLATNAYHAMEATGGNLKVSLDTLHIEPSMPFDPPLPPGEYACLGVDDTGSGIQADLLERIFDPYFTTKPKDKGTGLGLSVVLGIVRHCDGDIRVHSTPGQGTRMAAYFPIIEKREAAFTKSAGRPVQGGTERILFVDDEEGVVKMMNLMLKRLGYTVTSRIGSLDALQTFQSMPDRFDLVITDMTMPNMTGVQLAKEIRRVRPTMPIVICTGFSDQIDEARCKRMGLQGLIKKPVITRVMAATIRSALDEVSATAMQNA